MIVIQDLCDDFPMRNGAWRLLPACLAFFSLRFVSRDREREKKENSEIIHSVGMYSENIQKKNASDKNNKFRF
jgi:hypothetical protein